MVGSLLECFKTYWMVNKQQIDSPLEVTNMLSNLYVKKHEEE